MRLRGAANPSRASTSKCGCVLEAQRRSNAGGGRGWTCRPYQARDMPNVFLAILPLYRVHCGSQARDLWR
jgi:hypothetical protein